MTYGLTETAACATMLRPPDLIDDDGLVESRLARVGRPWPGYSEMPTETADASRDGGFRSGDLAVPDEDGYITIVDRPKDVIVSGGINVSSLKVEQVLGQHRAVGRVAVIGVPDKVWGEALRAVVVRRSGAEVSPDELIEWCCDRLASFKKPQSVEFVDTLPENTNGKILERELRERYWQGNPDKWVETVGPCRGGKISRTRASESPRARELASHAQSSYSQLRPTTLIRSASTILRIAGSHMPEYICIDSDTHLTEPADVWTSRVSAKFKGHVPYVERDARGRDTWMLEGQPVARVGLTAPAGWPEPFPAGPPTYEDCHPAAYDASARLALMDEQGIWAQVVYPNIAGFGGQQFRGIEDAELKLECVRAYNDFQRDWVEPDPRRFVTLVSTPFWDVHEMVAEIERGAAMGHRGILFTGDPGSYDLPVLGHSHWDPLWAVARDTELPVHFHIGSGDLSKALTPGRTAASGAAASYAYSTISLFMGNGIQLADLLLSGVLERFPEVKFVSVESGIGWVPFVLEACDYHVREANVAGRERFTMSPSELFRRQVYCCYWFEQIAPRRFLDLLPPENIMFETDFPHPTCLVGNIRAQIEAGLGGQSAEIRRMILWDNAAKLYHVEAPDQEPVAV